MDAEVTPDRKADLDEQHGSLLALANAVRRSIGAGCSGFFLLYHPIVNAKTCALEGAEALLRWKDPECGLVPPEQFVPIIENDPAFIVLGEWILRKAMTEARPLLKLHLEFTLNVNLAYAQLEQQSFASMVKRLLEETGFPPQNLCLEITERCRLMDISMLASVLQELRSIGIRFAIDDFGTGYSSMEVLNQLEFDVIKIDKAFVDHIAQSEKSAKLVTIINELAQVCGAIACAEGVETAEQYQIVKACGVHSIQGYYFSEPVSVEEIVENYGETYLHLCPAAE